MRTAFFGFLVAGLLIPVSAFANGYHCRHHYCLRESWEVVSDTITNKSACQAKDALELSEKWHSYPLLQEDAYRVEYWKGSFSRQVTSNRTVRHLLLNLCSGQTVIDTTAAHVINEQKEFALENPNLLETVSKSYELVPLTDAEAQAALAAARVKCESF